MGRVIIIMLVMLPAGLVHAERDDLIEVGFRAGADINETVDFDQYEAFVRFPLKWTWSFFRDWQLTTYAEGSLGALHADHKEGVLGGVGPGFSLAPGSKHFRLEGGSNLTLLSESMYSNHKLGGTVQATSYVSAKLRLYRGVHFSYRVHHISNGGLYNPNPGLDMHLTGLSFEF